MDLSRLTELATNYYTAIKSKNSALPNLSVLRREAPSNIEATIYEPVMCLILQGSKVTSIGDQSVTLSAGDVLLVSHDLPVVSRITEASIQRPYLAVILSLDMGLLRSLYNQVVDAPVHDVEIRSLSAGPVEQAWLAPLVRYFELMNSPLDATVLGPSIQREIQYRFLLSPLGRMLRDVLVADSSASRIAKSIHKVRTEFQVPLSVSDLAKTAGMSASSFHEHFKSVTGTTPLQYQKDLRLIAARTLLVDQGQTVSEVAYAVGYESPTHFSRDYSKKFGLPPSREESAS
jgi:AraC-like DNA-binding protein